MACWGMKDPDLEALLAEQIDFYRADAGPMDSFLLTLLDPANKEAASARGNMEWFSSFAAERAPLGRVLEIAAGGGLWAAMVAPFAEKLHLLDSSPESLELARPRLAPWADRVDYIQADIFSFEAARSYDFIFFTAWLHHIPLAAFDQFWSQVERLLAPGGWVLFSFPEPETQPPLNQELPTAPDGSYQAYTPEDGVSLRDLDGRRWRVAHVLWERAGLRERLRQLGWDMKNPSPGSDGWAEVSRLRPQGQ